MGSLCGCCIWCLLLLAGWCEVQRLGFAGERPPITLHEGFCGVRVSEALAAYVVLVSFLLVG